MIGLIVSSGLVSSLTGCASLKPFPTKYVYEYDRKNKVCGQYRITDPEHLKVEYEKDIPCIDIFGFSSSDIPKVLDWAEDAQEYVRVNCK